jgi:hypothetical protein
MKNSAEIIQLRILARRKPAAKWRQKAPRTTMRLLDRGLIIGGKCQIFMGSGKSPGLNHFALCGLRRDRLADPEKARFFLGTSSLFCADHNHNRLLQTFPAGDVRRFSGNEKSGEKKNGEKNI